MVQIWCHVGKRASKFVTMCGDGPGTEALKKYCVTQNKLSQSAPTNVKEYLSGNFQYFNGTTFIYNTLYNSARPKIQTSSFTLVDLKNEIYQPLWLWNFQKYLARGSLLFVAEVLLLTNASYWGKTAVGLGSVFIYLFFFFGNVFCKTYILYSFPYLTHLHTYLLISFIVCV